MVRTSFTPSTCGWLLLLLCACFGLGASNPSTARCSQTQLVQCTCTTDGFGTVVKVECIDTGLTNVGLFSQIPTTVQQVIVKGNDFSDLGQNLFGQCSSNHKYESLEILDLSNNKIRTIHGKTFHCIPNLQRLILDDNEWFVNAYKTAVFSNIADITHLHMANAFADSNGTAGITHIVNLKYYFENFPLTNLQVLHLERNDLWFIDDDQFGFFPNLQELYLDMNHIAKPKFVALENLWKLSLANNAIENLGSNFKSFVDTHDNLRVINMTGNPFMCDCDFVETYQWMHNLTDVDQKSTESSPVIDIGNIICNLPDDLAGKNALSLEEEQLVCLEVNTESRMKVSYGILGFTFAVVGVIMLAVLFLNRYKLKRLCKDGIIDPLRDAAFARETRYASVNI